MTISAGNLPNFGQRTIDVFKTKLAGGGARPNLFEVEAAFPAGLGLQADEDYRFLIKAASLPPSSLSVIDVPFRGRNLKIAGDRTFDPWIITIINDTDFKIRNAFERWMNFMNKLDDNAGIITPAAYQADWKVFQLGRGLRSTSSNANASGTATANGLPTGAMPTLKAYQFKGCFPTSVSAIDLSYDASDTIQEFTVELQVQWVDILNKDNADAAGSSGSLTSINATTTGTTNTGT
jgi:hypothetical protein